MEGEFTEADTYAASAGGLFKLRNGPTGKTRLAFQQHYTRFANMARTA